MKSYELISIGDDYVTVKFLCKLNDIKTVLNEIDRDYELAKKHAYIKKLEDGLANRTLSNKFYSRFGDSARDGSFYLSSSLEVVFSIPNCYDGIDEHWLDDSEVRMYLVIEEE